MSDQPWWSAAEQVSKPPWHDAAERGEWLETAKLAALDQRAASTFALTAATIALVEQLARRIPGTPL